MSHGFGLVSVQTFELPLTAHRHALVSAVAGERGFLETPHVRGLDCWQPGAGRDDCARRVADVGGRARAFAYDY